MIFNLHSLGWRDFQNLCGTILREILGQTCEQFADSSDAGRDGAFFGKWESQKGETMTGSFVYQCKFSARTTRAFQISDVTDEIAKARVLARQGVCENYILITNLSVRAPVAATLKKSFERIRGLRNFRILDGGWISQQITENQRLRTLVPRVYGLGDLTEILDERIYQQAQEILSWLGEELSRFVVTNAHHRSVRALMENRFVFLLGDAGTGKSTIAAALALAAADTWGSRVIKVTNPSDFSKHSNPNEPNQFFWVDDVFGQLKYEGERATQWNYLLPLISAAIARGVLVIFTSRRYIYEAAMEDLKDSAFPLLKESQVVIEVENLTKSEKEQILYNHIRLGDQNKSFKAALKDNVLEDVAAHPNFLPEIARRLGSRSFTKKLSPDRASVLHFVEHPDQYLKEQFGKFGDANRAAMALVFMKGGSLSAPLTDLSSEDVNTIVMLNSSLGEVGKALKVLDGPYIARQIHDGRTQYRFKHPTIRDGFGKFIAADPNLMDCYLRGTLPLMLLEEVTCGDVGLSGVALVIPQQKFSVMTIRLQELLEIPGGRKAIVEFLVSRCNIEFINNFLALNPNFVSSLAIDYWIAWSPVAKLYRKLQKAGMLDEKVRQGFVAQAKNAIVRSPQWSFMKRSNFRDLLKPQEVRAARASVRQEWTAAELKKRLIQLERDWKRSGSGSATDYFWVHRNELQSLQEEFRRNKSVFARFAIAHKRLVKLGKNLDSEKSEKSGDIEADINSVIASSKRSIFDDVDE